MTGKMSLKKRFVDCYRLHADALRSAFIEADDPIDHQKRITMRQNLHDLFAVEPAVAFRYHARQGKRVATRLLLGDGASYFCIGRVPGFHRNALAANSASDE